MDGKSCPVIQDIFQDILLGGSTVPVESANHFCGPGQWPLVSGLFEWPTQTSGSPET